MAGLFATFLALIASALIYLASPRQRLLRASFRPGASLGAALVCIIASAWLWCVQAGTVAGLCAATGALAAGLALAPFVGVYWRHDRRTRVSGNKTATPPNGGRPETS